MAEAALLMLDAVDAATARSWLKDGYKILTATAERFRAMAGLSTSKPAPRADDARANRKKLAALIGQMSEKKP